ncbi:retrovirus-related pol polyprotein from transposon TNT 1-94, partial [Tanacetum coccineum]
TMADMNNPTNDVPAEQAPAIAPPTRMNDQILSSSKWVPIGKSNCVLDVQKSQRNPIFPIVVAILKNTNFFRAFTASSTILAIYIQQDALDITPPNDNNPFVAPPSSDSVIEYVNTLGYPCITHRSNINYAERIWEEFVQSIQTFPTDRKNLATTSCGKKKTAHLLILNVRYVGKDGREIFDDKSPKPASSQPPKPTPTPTESSKKDQGKKRKLVMESTDAPSLAKRSKTGKVTKKRMPKSSLQLVDEVVDKGVQEKEPAHDDEEANLQRALELSLKEQG